MKTCFTLFLSALSALAAPALRRVRRPLALCTRLPLITPASVPSHHYLLSVSVSASVPSEAPIQSRPGFRGSHSVRNRILVRGSHSVLTAFRGSHSVRIAFRKRLPFSPYSRPRLPFSPATQTGSHSVRRPGSQFSRLETVSLPYPLPLVRTDR